MLLKPKNWEKFQHYKDRNPPWIKLHRDLMIDRAFMSLPLASKALAPFFWLLASESHSKDGTFNASDEELEFRLRISIKEIREGRKSLIEKGFFAHASNTQADASNLQTNAIPEAEREGETEEEKEADLDTKVSRPLSRTPSQRLLELFHQKCTYLPTVTVFSDARKRTLQARYKEVMNEGKWTEDQTIEWFGEFYELVNNSKFLTGRSNVKPGQRPFKADWDWIHAPSNFVKIVEGKYGD